MEHEFTAYRIDKADGGVDAAFRQMTVAGLTAGDVLIRAAYSCINY